MFESFLVKWGFFFKKVENKDGEKFVILEKIKRGKYKWEKLMVLVEVLCFEIFEDYLGIEGVIVEIILNVKVLKEKKKVKNLVYWLLFGKGGRKKKKICFIEEKENIYLEEFVFYFIEWWELLEGDSVKEGFV